MIMSCLIYLELISGNKTDNSMILRSYISFEKAVMPSGNSIDDGCLDLS